MPYLIQNCTASKPLANFDVVGLMVRKGNVAAIDTLRTLIAKLVAMQKKVVLHRDTAALLNDGDLMVLPDTEFAKRCHLAIVVGGDGTILRAGQALAGFDTPILGVNLGRMGFLADILPKEIDEKLSALFLGNYVLDTRFLLQMQIMQDGAVVFEDTALNDVVLHAGKSVHTIDYKLQIDGQDVYRHHADGLIIATPTGSTAYNLSAGGPIIHPKLEAICLAPMYPHTLSSRPIVVAKNSQICITTHKDNRTEPMVSCDGKPSVALGVSQTLVVQKFAHSLTLIHPEGFDFYEACRTKLHWSLYGDRFSLNA